MSNLRWKLITTLIVFVVFFGGVVEREAIDRNRQAGESRGRRERACRDPEGRR